MDGFSRILEKKLSELLCTRLYLKGISLRLASPHCAAAAPSGASCIHRESVHRPFCVVPCSPAVQNDLHRPPLTDARPERLNQQATRHDRVGWPSLHTYIYAHASHNRRRPLGTTRAGWPLYFILKQATRYDPRWLALRVSYGFNGVVVRQADVPSLQVRGYA